MARKTQTPIKCKMDGCDGKHKGFGYCNKHYQRLRNHGSPSIVKCIQGATSEERFWHKVKKTDGCWEWLAHKDKDGYGNFKVKGKTVSAHRFSYELHTGEIPQGLFVLHKCDNPSCVNPDHLFLGTHQDNMNDMVNKDRSDHGEKVNTAKLSEMKVREIVKRFKDGLRNVDIAREYGVTRQNVRSIRLGRTWKRVLIQEGWI